MIKLSRRTAIAGLATLPLVSARAQTVDFPDRPLRFIVGFPPGGPNDLLARVIAPGIGERLKRTVVVENRAGANGEIAAASVAKAPPDGGVFMLASNGSTTVAPALNRSMPYDIRTDFAAVAPVGINPMLLVVRNDLPAANIAELLALARARPGKLNGASAGANGATHLALELFKSMGRVDIVHVPYKGAGAGVIDLVGGQVQLSFVSIPTGLPFIKNNRLRALGVTTLKRTALYPDIPTIAEAALPGYDMSNWVGLMAPAQTPPEIVARLNAEIARWMVLPDTQQKMLALGVDAGGGSASSFTETIARGYALMGRTIQVSGIKVD